MNNIYIGDIHGLDVWKEIVDKHSDADNIVFIGDYFDSFNHSGVEQLHNVKEIVEFKKSSSSNVHLLIGNHDHHYWPNVKDKGSTSGFQPSMSFQFQMFFMENEEHFKIAVRVDKCLCTHAGVSMDFLEATGYNLLEEKPDVAEYLNDLFKYKPNSFIFGHYHNDGFPPNHYGDDVWQSPIWIRPKSLQKSNKKSWLQKEFIQIVGHTQQSQIDIKGKSTGGKYYYIDTLNEGQYLIEEDGEFKVGNCSIQKYI